MSFGVNRDYKTRDRSAEAHLFVHRKRMQELIDSGMDASEASKIAYKEIMDGSLADEIKDKIQDLKNRRAKHKGQ